MKTRLFASVEKTDEIPRVGHFQGLPPELTNEQRHRERLPWPRVLVIEEKSDGVFLFRFTTDGGFGGDTWHMSIDDAKHQAEYEYGNKLGKWKEIPSEVNDIVEFVLTEAD